MIDAQAALEPFRTGRAPSPGTFKLADPGFADALDKEGLAPLWFDALTATPTPAVRLRAALHPLRLKATAAYLLQRRSAERVCAILHGVGIRHALFKGAAIRERIYRDPAVRPATDIDILIEPGDRDSALRVLGASGLALHAYADTVSHEVMLLDGAVTIDLHWGLFRPGRSRIDPVPLLLDTARLHSRLTVLGDDANLLVMLVHPAFAKHVNGPTALLVRAVDLDRHLRSLIPDWNWILTLIERAGLRAAAWATLYWVRTLLDTPVDAAVLARLEPPPLQRRYLTYWIDRQLPARLAAIPGLVQGAFTLALHERPRDALRALSVLARCRIEGGATAARLRALASSPRGSE